MGKTMNIIHKLLDFDMLGLIRTATQVTVTSPMGVSLEYSRVSTAVDHSSNLASFTWAANFATNWATNWAENGDTVTKVWNWSMLGSLLTKDCWSGPWFMRRNGGKKDSNLPWFLDRKSRETLALRNNGPSSWEVLAAHTKPGKFGGKPFIYHILVEQKIIYQICI